MRVVSRISLWGLAVVLPLVPQLRGDIITESLHGTVTSGFDKASIFGPAFADLTGKSVTFQFTVDMTLLRADGFYSDTAGLLEQIINAGIGDGAITNSITINGITFSVTQAAGGTEFLQTQKEGTGSLLRSVVNNTDKGADFVFHSTTAYQDPKLGVGQGGQAYADLIVSTLTQGNIGLDLLNASLEDDLVVTLTTTVTHSPIPEPASLALLIPVLLGSLYVWRKRQHARV